MRSLLGRVRRRGEIFQHPPRRLRRHPKAPFPPPTTGETPYAHKQAPRAAATPSRSWRLNATAAPPHRRHAADLVCGGGGAAAIAPLPSRRRPRHVGYGDGAGSYSTRLAAAAADRKPRLPRRRPHRQPGRSKIPPAPSRCRLAAAILPPPRRCRTADTRPTWCPAVAARQRLRRCRRG